MKSDTPDTSRETAIDTILNSIQTWGDSIDVVSLAEAKQRLQALVNRAVVAGRMDEALVIANVRTRGGLRAVRQFGRDRAQMHKTRLTTIKAEQPERDEI